MTNNRLPRIFKKNFLYFLQDTNSLLVAGYENFQRVALALEFVTKDLQSNMADYSTKQGRSWFIAHGVVLRVLLANYLSIISDPSKPDQLIIPRSVVRNSIPSEVRCIQNESYRDRRDWLVLRDSIRGIEHFIRSLDTAYRNRRD